MGRYKKQAWRNLPGRESEKAVGSRLFLGTALVLTAFLAVLPGVAGQETKPDADKLYEEAWKLYEQGRYAEAFAVDEHAIAILKQKVGENDPAYANALNRLAEDLFLTVMELRSERRFAEALSTAQKAAEIIERVWGENSAEYLSMLDHLSALYWAMGQQYYENVEQTLQQAMKISKHVSGENSADYAISLNNLGVFYSDRGKYDEAESPLRQALTILSHASRENREDYANSLDNLGLVYLNMGQYGKAEPLLKKGVKIARYLAKGNVHWITPLESRVTLLEARRRYAKFLSDLTTSLQARGRRAEARQMYDEVMRVEQDYVEHKLPFVSLSTTSAGNHLHSLDRLISLAAGSDDPQTVQWALNWTLRNKGEIFNTIRRFRLLQEISAPDFSARLHDVQRRQHGLALNPPKGMDAQAQDREQASLQRVRNESEEELNRTLAQVDEMYGGLIEQLTGQNPQKLAENIDFRMLQKCIPEGSVMIYFVQIRPFNFKAIGRARRWEDSRYFAFVISADKKTSPQLIDVADEMEIRLAIQTLRGNIQAHVNWLNSPTGRSATVSERGERDKSDESEYRQLASRLYDLLFMKSGLKDALGAAKTIYVSPDGMLNQVPFETLVAGGEGPQKPGNYLVEAYKFIYLTTAQELLPSTSVFLPAEKEMGRGTVVFAAPDYDMSAIGRAAGKEELLLARREAAQRVLLRGDPPAEVRGKKWVASEQMLDESKVVESELSGTAYGPVTLYTGKNALEERFLSMKAPRILHVVTHGFFVKDESVDPDERQGFETMDLSPESGASRGLTRLRVTADPLLRSGLIFAGANRVGTDDEETAEKSGLGDGWVTAEEVAQMDLRGTELVVLSACESGLGDVQVAEGVQGLQQSFFLAGARSLVMSLNEVPDRDTEEFMKEFYRNLINGNDKAAALRDAELTLIEKRWKEGRSTYPFYWGSFVFVGNPNRE